MDARDLILLLCKETENKKGILRSKDFSRDRTYFQSEKFLNLKLFNSSIGLNHKISINEELLALSIIDNVYTLS